MKGYIFRCNEKTKSEVTQKGLMGEERMYLPIVRGINSDDLLFLYDLSTYEFSGPYIPICPGSENIDASAWKTLFPAQIRFKHAPETKSVPFRLIERVIRKYRKGVYPDMELSESQTAEILDMLNSFCY